MPVEVHDKGASGHVYETTAAADTAIALKSRADNDTKGIVTGGGRVEAAGGSVSAPGFAFYGDDDTGLFRQAANTLSITAGGTEVMRCFGTTLGFFGAAGRAKGATFTQTYSTSDATISAYTPDAESGAYTGGSTDAALALNTDLNALRTAYENLRAMAEDHLKATNSLIDQLQELGLVG